MCCTNNQQKTVGVGLSGGTDSAAAALMLLEQQYHVIGYTMLTTTDSGQVAEKARTVAEHLGIEHRVIDLRETFQREILDMFVESYANGLTPSPCVVCNRLIKFGTLRERILADGCDCMATGHFAVIKTDGDRFQLWRGVDKSKDQSYFLAQLRQEQFSRVLLPLGNCLKSELKDHVKNLGIVPKSETESQDLCFLPNGCFAEYVSERRPELKRDGWIVDLEGRRLGRHAGAYQYTAGQRKGLGLGGGPWFVVKTDMERNEVVICHKEQLGLDTLHLHGLNWLAPHGPSCRCHVQIRYLMKPRQATVTDHGNGTGTIVFDEKIDTAPPGQLAVGYIGDQVVFSGWIANA